jgi:hypothetical protein
MTPDKTAKGFLFIVASLISGLDFAEETVPELDQKRIKEGLKLVNVPANGSIGS